jgi:hypothetical protein
MELNYKQRMVLLDILKEAKEKQSSKVYSIDCRFKDTVEMPQDKLSYWLSEQAKAYDLLDSMRDIIETIKPTV